MKKMNFKNHRYLINWISQRGLGGPLDIIRLNVFVTRDGAWPFAEVVTDIHELRYACILNDFDYNSLDKDENGYFIKRDSLEWNKYLKEPGVPIKQHINNIINDDVRIIPVEEEGDYYKIPLDLISDLIDQPIVE
jgi:hypothetical protein